MLDRNQTIHFSTGALLMPKLAHSLRIGISQAKDLQLRFFVDGSPFVSGRAGDHSMKRDRFLGTTLKKVSTR